MGGYAKIINDGSDTYKEIFNEREIVIKPKETITMPRSEAVKFMGTMSKPLPNGGWTEKKLRILEYIDSADKKSVLKG